MTIDLSATIPSELIAYHFTGQTLRDGRSIPPIGEWLVHNGPVVMCASGLHASRQPWDALTYAQGPFLHKVECKGFIQEDGDKLVCRRRKIVKSIDATELLRYFARMRALSVVHMWDAPDVMLDFLMTGDESIMDAARAAARAAAWDYVRGAAWVSARCAAKDAAWIAAMATMRDSSWHSARCAAKDAAWIAAMATMRDSSWHSANQSSSWDAAKDAAKDAARHEFNELVYEQFA